MILNDQWMQFLTAVAVLSLIFSNKQINYKYDSRLEGFTKLIQATVYLSFKLM